MSKRVVLTGLGMITPLGNSTAATWKGLLVGASGVGPITQFDTTAFDVKIAAEVRGFVPEDYINKKEARRMDRFTQLGVAAAKMAWDDAGARAEMLDMDSVGVVIGSGVGGLQTHEEQHRTLIEKGPGRVSPFYIPMQIADITAGHVSMMLGAKGPNYATISACATSAHAIADAFLLISQGYADMILAGGSEATICPLAVAGFSNMRALSTNNDNPTIASRPFDRNRDGFVLGEGAGVVVVEELEHALKRGAKIYAELGGVGMTGDAYHITQPDPNGTGAKRAMAMALKGAGAALEEVDYINAHGTSTPLNDKFETGAIKSLFGKHAYSIAISSTKSMTGHLLGAAGAVECGITALALLHGIVPPTANYQTPDPDCDLNYTPNKPVEKQLRVAVSNSFGFGGHNAALVLKRYT